MLRCDCNNTWLVVMKMGILEQSSNPKNCIKSTNKIPEYARDFKNEWLFIRGINNEFKYFVDNYFSDIDIFISKYSNRIKSFIEKFIKLQELNYLKDISCFKFKGIDVENIVFYLKECNLILMKVFLIILQDIEIFMSCFVNSMIK